MTGEIAVVIVAYETRDAAIRCVVSVLDHGAVPGRSVRTILVDNASRDGTAAAVTSQFGPARVEVVPSARNAGFGAAANLGAARAPEADWYLVLNADTELTAGALAALVAAGERDPDAAAVGPRVVGEDGSPQVSVRGHPTRLALLHQHTALRFLRIGAAAYARYRDPPRPEALMGAALLVRGEDFRAIRGFSSRYFLYFEDADLCRRLERRGRALLVEEAAVVRHTGGASADRDRERALTWYLRSLFQYVDCFHGRAAGLAFRAAFKPLFLVRLVTDAIRDAAGAAVGRPGKREELRTARRFLGRGLWEFLRS